MIASLVLALLLQGPRPLQAADDKPIPPATVVPAGTTIPVELITRISTKTAKDGDNVYARTVFPITIDNKVIIPVGSNLKGKIGEVDKGGRVKGKPSLTLSFQILILPTGLTYPILASLGGPSSEGTREGESTIKGDGSKGADATTVGTTAASGAGLGGLATRSGKGVGVGAAGGAAVGLATVLLTRGKDLVLNPGTQIEVVLDHPLER